VPFGDSDAMRVGDWVMAMGNPLGQGFSVSVGIVSASGRALSGTYDDYIQTDAAINRGNSGGPLFNLDGEVIGVNTAILSPTGGSIGIGFAMSSDVVTNVVAQLREFGETRRGWLGVRIQDVSADIAESMGLEQARGALVTDVPEGPAREGGIAVGDVILSLDGQDIQDTRALVRIVGESAEGQTVRIVVVRDGATETLRVTLGRRETAEGQAAHRTRWRAGSHTLRRGSGDGTGSADRRAASASGRARRVGRSGGRGGGPCLGRQRQGAGARRHHHRGRAAAGDHRGRFRGTGRNSHRQRAEIHPAADPPGWKPALRGDQPRELTRGHLKATGPG
jgi:hypothetical protein